jgi:signal transduction histidine kinase/putative methionine-R-sulfoxide reductase with GAF domain
MTLAAEPDARLLDALDRLNRIGAAINGFGGAPPDTEATLLLIAESAVQVLPGACAAILCAYDRDRNTFDAGHCIRAGSIAQHLGTIVPRPQGFGQRALDQRRYVISYKERDLDLHPSLAAAGARTAACYPLVVADQDVGTLYLYLDEQRLFSQTELLLLASFANQAALALYQARTSGWVHDVERDLARTEDELSRLRHAGLLISSRLGLEQTLEAILQMALEVTDAHYGIFRLVDAGRQNLVTRALAGEHLDRPLVEALPIEANSVMSWVARRREAVCIRDLHAEPWADIYYPLDAGLEMRSEVAVPLISASGRLEGVLNLESPAVGAFSDGDRRLLQSLATQAVIAIQEVRLLDALQEVAQILLTQPCQQVLDRLVALACELLNAAASAIWTLHGVDDDGVADDGAGEGEEELRLAAASTGHRRGDRLPLHGSLTGQAILSGGPVTAEDLRTDERFHRPDLAAAQDWARALVVPLLASKDGAPSSVSVGAFSVYSTSPELGRFAESEWDAKVLTVLAHYAALAVHNAARQEALRQAQERHAVAETFAAVGDIAANLLHQLNNKVGTIPVRVQGIQDKCQPAVLADLYLAANLQEIEKSATEAMEAVRENLSHLHPIRLAPVDVAACVADAVRSSAGVTVETEQLDSLPAVIAGQRSLTLVFANLLENAAKAMGGEGRVTIRGTARGNWVGIAVSDSGPGIAPELHDRIFELNFSHGASNRGTRARGKLGFGLWWVKTLMARLGGSVAVESDGQHGTTFRLTLPRAQDGAFAQEGAFVREGARAEGDSR